MFLYNIFNEGNTQTLLGKATKIMLIERDKVKYRSNIDFEYATKRTGNVYKNSGAQDSGNRHLLIRRLRLERRQQEKGLPH